MAAPYEQLGITSVLKYISGDHELTQGLVLVIDRFACFFQDFTEAGGCRAYMFHCIRPVLIGFAQGIEGGGHSQSGLTQTERLSPPPIAIIGYRVVFPVGQHSRARSATRRVFEALIFSSLSEFTDFFLSQPDTGSVANLHGDVI